MGALSSCLAERKRNANATSSAPQQHGSDASPLPAAANEPGSTRDAVLQPEASKKEELSLNMASVARSMARLEHWKQRAHSHWGILVRRTILCRPHTIRLSLRAQTARLAVIPTFLCWPLCAPSD
eukprot:4974684-Prymnesium_polylepis.1